MLSRLLIKLIIYVAGWLKESKNFLVCVIDQLSDHFVLCIYNLYFGMGSLSLYLNKRTFVLHQPMDHIQ